MPPHTLDIIYRFIADTKQFEQQVKGLGKTTGKVPGDIQAPDYKKTEAELRNVSREITRLRDTGQITVENAAKLKKQYADAKREVAQLARELDKIVKQRGQSPTGVTPQLRAQLGKVAGPGMGMYEGKYVPGEIADYEDALEKTFQKTRKGFIDLRTNTQVGEESVRQFAKEFQMGMTKSASAVGQANQQVITLQKNAQKGSASLEELGRALMVKGFSFYGLRLVGASVVQIGQLASVLGGAATAGVFKGATEYIKKAESLGKSNEVTREWAKSMQSVEKSQERIGKVLASQTLPFLQKGAELLGRLSSYLEKNPEQAGRLIKGGLALTGLGALIMAVGKGINLISDTAFIVAAAQMAVSGRENIVASGVMRQASKENLLAATVMSKSKGIGAGGAGAAGLLGSASLLIGTTSIAAILTDKVFDVIQKRDVQMADYITTAKQTLSMMAGGLGWASQGIANTLRPKSMEIQGDTGQKWFTAVARALGLIPKPAKEASDSLENLSDVLANSAKREEALKAFEDYKADDLELLRKYYADRQKVEADAQSAILKANKDLAAGIAKAYADQASQIAKATADYKASEEKAARDYQEKRDEILRDAGEDVLKIEEDLQEKLRKLRMEYQDRETELLAQRDAVGLIKNRQKFIRDQSEAQREANREIAKRREETGKKLAELQREYEQERAQRFADWQAKLKEIQIQTKLEIDELRKKHAEELREIQMNRNARLKELDLQLNEERKRRYNAFISTIRDLDAALLGEENLKKNYYDLMLKDLDAFLVAYRNGMKSLQTVPPSRQSGGYVNGGVYRLHSGEFVINPSTTNVLEQMLGRKLTQSSLLQMAGTSSRTNVVWNDSRRFDSSLQASDRRAINNDTIALLGSVVGG